jgi:hypothetical protein
MAVSPNTDFTSGQILTATQQNNFPRGVMQYVINTTTNPTVTTTKADVTGMTVTWTAVANRLYRLNFEGMIGNNNASQNQFFFADASNVDVDNTYHDVGAGQFASLSFQYLFTTTAGSKTLKLRAQSSSGTLTFYGSGGRSFSLIVEDLGPA